MSRIRLYVNVLLATIAIVAVSCSPAKLLERGEVSTAFERAARQFERQGKASAKTGTALAAAYRRLQGEGYARVDALRARGRAEETPAVADALRALHRRERRVHAIRLGSKRVLRGFAEAEPDYAGELAHANRAAARYLLAAAERLVGLSRGGGRPDYRAAREACALLARRDDYAEPTASVNRLRDEAREFGTVRVGIVAEGLAATRAIDRVADAARRRYRADWVAIELIDPAAPRRAPDALDLLVEVDLDRVDVSLPDRSRETETYRRTIEKRVQVGVDTSGTPIYEVEEECVSAAVTTYAVERRAAVRAYLIVSDHRDGAVLREEEVRGVYAEENLGLAVDGDRRALEGVSLPSCPRGRPSAPSRAAVADGAIAAVSRALPRWDLDALALGDAYAHAGR